MADFDPAKVLAVLKTNKGSLAGDEATQDAILKEAGERLGARSSDDQKEASKIAVETAKLFVTIGTGVLIAIGTFVQFARNSGIPWDSPVTLSFAAGAGTVLISMFFGFMAISRIYKRAEGRLQPSEPAWSAKVAKNHLDWQGIFGLISLAALVFGLGIWSLKVPNSQASIALNIGNSLVRAPADATITIEGSWTSLKLKTATGQELTLPAQKEPFAIACR